MYFSHHRASLASLTHPPIFKLLRDPKEIVYYAFIHPDNTTIFTINYIFIYMYPR